MSQQEAPKPEPAKAGTTGGPRPTIDHQFWFDLSKEWIQQSVTKLDEAAAKLQAAVGWLWGIYTAGATVGLALSKLSYPPLVNVLIASPSVALIFAYLFAVWAQMPKRKYSFDSRVPSEIKETHYEIVYSKRRWFMGALISCGVAAALVVSAILVASFSHQAVEPDFKASVHSYGGEDTIALSVELPEGTDIYVFVSAENEDGVSQNLATAAHMMPSSGEWQTSIALGTTAEKYSVTVEWDEDGVLHSLERTVSPPG